MYTWVQILDWDPVQNPVQYFPPPASRVVVTNYFLQCFPVSYTEYSRHVRGHALIELTFRLFEHD